MIQKNGWGPSVLDRAYTEISQLGEVMGYCRAIMHDISIQVYKLENLREPLEKIAGIEKLSKHMDSVKVRFE